MLSEDREDNANYCLNANFDIDEATLRVACYHAEAANSERIIFTRVLRMKLVLKIHQFLLQRLNAPFELLQPRFNTLLNHLLCDSSYILKNYVQ